MLLIFSKSICFTFIFMNQFIVESLVCCKTISYYVYPISYYLILNYDIKKYTTHTSIWEA